MRDHHHQHSSSAITKVATLKAGGSFRRRHGHTAGAHSVGDLDMAKLKSHGQMEELQGGFSELDAERCWRIFATLILHKVVDCSDLDAAAKLCNSTFCHLFKFLPKLASVDVLNGEDGVDSVEIDGESNARFVRKMNMCCRAM